MSPIIFSNFPRYDYKPDFPAVVSTKSISLSADKRNVNIQRNCKGLGFAVVSDGPVIVTSVENGG